MKFTIVQIMIITNMTILVYLLMLFYKKIFVDNRLKIFN